MNRKPLVKICGITSLEDARFAAGCLTDRIGFIFTESSRRWIDPAKAGAIIQWLSGVECVGVFMNQTVEQVVEIVRKTGIHRIQLHGNESVEECEMIRRESGGRIPLVKTLSVPSGGAMAAMNMEKMQSAIDEYGTVVDEYLFDTSLISVPAKGGTVSSETSAQAATGDETSSETATMAPLNGGTGVAFDWSQLALLTIPKPFWIAGGLTSENIDQVWAVARPEGFDLSSGVEGDPKNHPGVKDYTKMIEFFDSVETLRESITQ